MVTALLKDVWVVSHWGHDACSYCEYSCMGFSASARLTFSGTDTQVLVACSIFGVVFYGDISNFSKVTVPFHVDINNKRRVSLLSFWHTVLFPFYGLLCPS